MSYYLKMPVYQLLASSMDMISHLFSKVHLSHSHSSNKICKPGGLNEETTIPVLSAIHNKCLFFSINVLQFVPIFMFTEPFIQNFTIQTAMNCTCNSMGLTDSLIEWNAHLQFVFKNNIKGQINC